MSDRTNGMVAYQFGLDESGRHRFGGRLRPLVNWLEKSRDGWKRKYMDVKVELHRMRVRVRDVVNSRDQWRERAEVSEIKVAEMQAELERLRDYVSEPPSEEKLGWLREYREEINQWSEYQCLIDTALAFVRDHGYFQGAAEQLEARMALTKRTEAGAALSAELVEFVRGQSEAARLGEPLPGSSEILESAFGKFKSLERDQSQRGFTHLVLAFAALLGETTPETVRQALVETPVKNVTRWCQEHLGATLHAKRTMVSRFLRRGRARQIPEEALT